MEIENVTYTVMDLERRTYRYLQKLAKSLSLPSNVKKVHLIHLIHAKKYKSEDEVNNIIQQVKSERQKLMQNRRNRKRHLQNREVSSTSKLCQSPSITQTPKRSVHPVLRYSPDFPYSFSKCSRNILPNSNITARSITSSDRVLRSFNLKAIRKSYGAVNVNNNVTSVIGVQNQATSPKEKVVRIASGGGLTKMNLAGDCPERRHRPSILGGNCLIPRNENPKQYIIPHNPQVMLHQGISVPHPKRQRTLSGIYPLIPQEIPYRSFDQIQGLRLRHTDGRLTTINALVRKRAEMKPPVKRSDEISIQEILNTIDVNLNNPALTNNNYSQAYPNASNPAVRISTPLTLENYKENDLTDEYSVYYHKKIRSEQVRYQRMNYREQEERLPKIADVFSKFNSVPTRNVTEPLYVQVSEESERFPSYSVPGRNMASSHMLENLYNFKASLLTNAPLLQIATTANTKCVYSTPVIATAMAQQTAHLVALEPFNMAPCEPDNQYRCSHDIEMPQLYEMLKHPNQDAAYRPIEHIGDMRTSTSPMLPQSLVTIPEMVEDALEIISQDGDYMERIGMDVRVQCVLCSWAGPKIILEFHIRKEHPSQIHKHRSEWSLVFTLGALAGGLWLSQLLEHDEALCVLSAQYREPDCVVATLCSLSSDPVDKFVTITTYNKVSGEPYTWEGPVQPLPPNLPYENDLPGLTVELSKLDLLPNSANLQLLNKELVLKSPTKVVVGQPELNNIHIIMFVTIS